MCVHLYMHACLYVLHAHMYTCACLYVACTCVHVCIHESMSAHVCMCAPESVYV